MNSVYGLYKQSRNASWQCLIDYHIDRLPVQITRIVRLTGIRLVENSKVLKLTPHESGRSICDGNHWTIIYDEEDTPQRCRFTVAHELGHILLGHNAKGVYSAEEETAANVFASRLLAPACVLWALDIHSAQEIKELCNISMSAASIRAERMKVLYARNKFLLSDLEKRVYEQFLPFIHEVKQKLSN